MSLGHLRRVLRVVKKSGPFQNSGWTSSSPTLPKKQLLVLKMGGIGSQRTSDGRRESCHQHGCPSGKMSHSSSKTWLSHKNQDFACSLLRDDLPNKIQGNCYWGPHLRATPSRLFRWQQSYAIGMHGLLSCHCTSMWQQSWFPKPRITSEVCPSINLPWGDSL